MLLSEKETQIFEINLADYILTKNVLNQFGSIERRKVLPILQRLRSNHSQLSWDDHFRVIENGNPIPGSNIHDLLRVITSRSKKIRATPGLKTFIKHLNKLNVPLYVAGTDASRRY